MVKNAPYFLPKVPKKMNENNVVAEPEGFEPSIGLYNPITV